MDTCHLNNAELEAQHHKYKRSSCTPWWYCQRRLRVIRSIHRTRVISISNDSRQKHGYHLQIARLRWTSSRRSISLYPSKNGRCSQKLKIPKSECPDIWIRLPRHNWPKSWSREDPVVPLERNLYGHPLAGLLWERQFEKILLKHGWEKIPNWRCLFVHREKGLFLSVYADDIKLAGKKQKSWSDVETTQQRSRFGRTNIFPGSRVLGLHSTTMPNKQRYCGQLQNHVRIENFRGESRETTIPSKSSYLWSYDMAGHAKKCVERYCESANKTTQQLHKVSTPCIDDHHFKEEETKSVGEFVKYMLSDCSEMFIFGKNWTTWYFMVSKQARTIPTLSVVF